MRLIYEAANSLEAHMILNLFEQAGLSGRVEGVYLQGAMGELPASGLVKVMISDEDYLAAREILSEWDRQQSAESDNYSVKKQASFATGLMGFIAGIFLTVVFYNTSTISNGLDYNGDGKPNEKHFYFDGKISRIEFDRNLDGKTDFIFRIDRSGNIVSSIADNDFNGSFESEVDFRINKSHFPDSEKNQ
jgi:hypothetical protein